MELHLMQQFWLVPLYSHPEASIVVAVIFLLLLNSVEELVGVVICAEQSSVVNFSHPLCSIGMKPDFISSNWHV